MYGPETFKFMKTKFEIHMLSIYIKSIMLLCIFTSLVSIILTLFAFATIKLDTQWCHDAPGTKQELVDIHNCLLALYDLYGNTDKINELVWKLFAKFLYLTTIS